MYVSVGLWLADRAGLEASMHPVVLLGHGADFCFDPGIHAGGIRFDVFAREIGPRVADFQPVALAAGQHARYAGNYGGSRSFGKAGESGNRRRLDAKKRNKNRIAAAEVEVGQVVENAAGAHGLDRSADAILAREHDRVAKANSAFPDDVIEYRVALRGIDGDSLEAHGDGDAADVKPEKVRSKQDDRPPGGLQCMDLFDAIDLDQARNVLRAGPPENAAFNDAAPQRLEVGAG